MVKGMEQITASAGSGKTYTLTRRFLLHLRDALPDGGPSFCFLEGRHMPSGGKMPHSLEGILAATFTNKAAAEMQARVIRELKQQALEKDGGDPFFPLTPEQARRWVGIILRRFNAVNIRTIDSLLYLLVRLNALSLSLPPDFALAFSLDDALTPLYDQLLDQVEQNPGGETERLFRDACRSLLIHNHAKGVAAGDILRKRLREVIDLHMNGAPLPDEKHGRKAAAALAALNTAMIESAMALYGIVTEHSLAVNAHAMTFLGKCRDCPPMTVPDLPDTHIQKSEFDDWLNKKSRGMAPADAHAAYADFRAAYTALIDRGPAFSTTIDYMPIVALAKALIRGIDLMQTEKGVVSASRLPLLARESLESGNGVSDAFCRLGDTLVHLLFDEFQDTSTDQWQAILPLVEECLSHGGSLTYVGDVKQAIYGWRGGNAELFNAVARDGSLTSMLEDAPVITPLTANWRSAPAIVHTNNRIFGQLESPDFVRSLLESILPATTAPMLLAQTVNTLTAAFTGCRQEVPPQNAAKRGFVRLTRIEEHYSADLKARVREDLRALLLEDCLARRTPGEIAILIRKNDEASEVSGWLAEWGVPVVTEHSFRLGSHPLITRLVDALSFLEYPMDDAAFWSAVSGPELFADVGMPKAEELADWLAETRARGGGPLFTAFRRTFPDVWRWTLGPFHDQTGLLGAYDMACELVRHCRLVKRYPEHEPFLQRFAEVAHAAENKGFSSLSAFLGYWAENGADERVPMPQNMDAVRILSIHKAKGLEFPVVIIPFHHQTDPTVKPLAVDTSSGMPLITYRDKSAAESVRGTAEQINLLYVAWTRPTEELYAFITQSGHSASHSSLGKALEALLENTPFKDGVYEYGDVPAPRPTPAGRAESVQEERASLRDGEAAVTGSPPDTAPQPLMSWLPRLKIFRNLTEGKLFSERQRGLLAHACLEALRLTGDLETDIARAVAQGLRAFPVPLPDPDAVRRDMAAVLAWYAALPETPTWMRHGSPEQPVMDADGSIRRVDLLVDAPASPLLAVEYKTGQPSADHAFQVERYLSLMAASVRRREPGRQIAGVVVYLDLRELVPVAEPSPRMEDGA